jgi:hypothetical protein
VVDPVIARRVLEVFGTFIDCEQQHIFVEDDLKGSGIDAKNTGLTKAGLAMTLEAEFGIRIPMIEMHHTNTVGELIETVARRIEAKERGL